jgi:hypothetical protein
LTPATFGPAALTVLALPFGFIEVGVAEVAGFYGLYLVLPAVVAWCLDTIRTRLPSVAQQTLGVLVLLVAIPAGAYLLLFTGPWFIFAVPPTAVVLIVAGRLVRARPPSHPNTIRPANPAPVANASR